jgi:hypothetical protein
MRKLMRTLVLGAMVAVLSSATAAAQPPAGPPARPQDPVQEFRAGERATLGQPVSHDEAVQRFRAGERASMTEAAAPDRALQEFRSGERASQAQPGSTADDSSLAELRRAYYQSTRVQPPAAAQPAERGTPVALLAALAGAAVLALSLDALAVRRKARKATARTAT